VKKNSFKRSIVFLTLFSLLSLPAVGMNSAVAENDTSKSANYTVINLKEMMTANTSVSENSQDDNTATISLKNTGTNLNQILDEPNMAPGDTIIKEYDFIVNNDNKETNLKLEMQNTSPNATPDLAGKLLVNIKAKTGDNVTSIYTGTISDLIKKPLIILLDKASIKTQEILFTVEFRVPAEIGNEYQNMKYSGNFKWAVYNDIAVLNPDTSDNSNIMLSCILLIVGACISLGLRKAIIKKV
jgi:hypothetical protein